MTCPHLPQLFQVLGSPIMMYLNRQLQELILCKYLQTTRIVQIARMQPSQIFDVIVPAQEYHDLQQANARLTKQNQQSLTEIEELKTTIKKFTEKAEGSWEQPQQIAHLSRTVMRLSRTVLVLRGNCEQLKTESEGRKQTKEMEELMAEKQRIWLQKMNEARETEQELRNRAELGEDNVRSAEERAKLMEERIARQEEQLLLAKKAETVGEIKVEALQSEIRRLEEDARQKDILLLNERNIMQQQIGKEKRLLEQYQQVLEAKSQQVVKRYDELQSQKEQKQEQFKRRRQQLDASFALKQQERAQELSKSINSLRQFEVVDEEEDQLKSQLTKTIVEADDLRGQLAKAKQSLAKLKKKWEDANNRAEYLQSIYEDPENMDHGIISVYIRHLQSFRNKLREIKEPDLAGKVALKKCQMLQQLQKQFRRMMEE